MAASDYAHSDSNETDVSVASTTNLDGERVPSGSIKRSARDKHLRSKLHALYAKNGRHDITQTQWCRMHKLNFTDQQWENLEKAEMELPPPENVPAQRVPLKGSMKERCGFFKPHIGKLCMYAHTCAFYHSTVSNPPDERRRDWQLLVRRAAVDAGFGPDTNAFKASKPFRDYWWPVNCHHDPTFTEAQERNPTCDPNDFGLGHKGKGDSLDKGKSSSSGKPTYKSKSDSSRKPDKGRQDKSKPDKGKTDKGKPDKGTSDYGKGNPYGQMQEPAPVPFQAPLQAPMRYCSDVHRERERSIHA